MHLDDNNIKNTKDNSLQLKSSRVMNLQQAQVNNIYIPEKAYNKLKLEDKKDFLLVDKHAVFKFELINDLENDTEKKMNNLKSDTVLLSQIQREYLNKSLVDTINLSKMPKKSLEPLSSIRIKLQTLILDEIEFDQNFLVDSFKNIYEGYPFNDEQKFYFHINHTNLVGFVTEITTQEDEFDLYGVIDENTKIIFTSGSNNLRITGNKIFTSLESLGIGGLSDQFNVMFRRAFIQRSLDQSLIKKMGIDHVKGIMLHGPPGTGKTLIARKIGTLLDAHPPKIVNGPEILNKYVGQSEENIRELFKDAEIEYKEKKNNSKLHIIIFDEIDAICKKRGSSEFGDQVVNQLLSKIDGVDSLNNILVIGMTNRIDLIDSALLRPGRFEIKIEIGLPDENGRYEVFKIHTKSMSKNKLLAEDVDLEHLAKITENYTGAEIAAIVKSAASYSLQRNYSNENKIDTSNVETNEDLRMKDEKKDFVVTNTDFLQAISEIKPAFGIDDSDFSKVMKIFCPLPMFINLIDQSKKIINRLSESKLYHTGSILLHGIKGTGKTTLSLKIANESKYSFFRIISPLKIIGLSEFEKINYIKETFLDAYRCEYSVIVLDELESLIDFVGIGPRFSNPILQALKIFIKNENNNTKRNKILIIGTTSNMEVMVDVGMKECFDFAMEVPTMDMESYKMLRMDNSDITNQQKLNEKEIDESFEEGRTIRDVISEINTVEE